MRVQGRSVDLPVMLPVQPMLAKSISGTPDPASHVGLAAAVS